MGRRHQVFGVTRPLTRHGSLNQQALVLIGNQLSRQVTSDRNWWAHHVRTRALRWDRQGRGYSCGSSYSRGGHSRSSYRYAGSSFSRSRYGVGSYSRYGSYARPSYSSSLSRGSSGYGEYRGRYYGSYDRTLVKCLAGLASSNRHRSHRCLATPALPG